MIYIDALQLLETCLKNGILEGKDDKIYVYRKGTEKSKAGWYLSDKDTVAKELMEAEEGQKMLSEALKKKGANFTSEPNN